ncbi:hypothetical protein O7599_18585 [Streptomyces sp. WMMC500]|uniref:hypothetical protein n=1 Tax=Streptomyces sp. WMMC500 TaxID=3015154 RepID=UPI00248C270F|nr:hypothetical protein [Streptomyces sp. WMMC500]WBB57696.1 hypothetical protein O7599_18585 [Streptomyces sp. WMMC500]
MKHVIRGRRAAVAAAGAAALLALTACGGDDEGDGGEASGGPAQADAVKAMRTVTSVHAAGEMILVADPVTIDVQVDDKGNCVGSASGDEGAVEFVMQGDTAWVKPDAAYLESEYMYDDAVIAEVEGSYLEEAKADAQSALVDLCKLDTYVEQTNSVVSFSPGMTQKEQTKHEGVAVVPYVNEDPSTSDGASMKIAADGKPYPVTITDPEGAEVDLAFSAFGKPVKAEAPAADSVLTEEQLSDIRLEAM